MNHSAEQVAIGQNQEDAFSSEDDRQFEFGVMSNEPNGHQEQALGEVSIGAEFISGKTPPGESGQDEQCAPEKKRKFPEATMVDLKHREQEKREK